MDVSVTMQLKFQQSIVEFFMVPQLQFIDRVVDTLVAPQRQVHSANCAEVRRDSSGAVLGLVSTPLLYNDRCAGLTVQKTVEVPQLQYFDRVVDVPAAVHRQGLDVLVISRRCFRFSSLAELDYDGSEGVFRPFWSFFALLRVVPELSASRSWGALDDEEFFVIEGSCIN